MVIYIYEAEQRCTVHRSSVFLPEGLGDGGELHVARALVDRADLAVAVELLLGEVAGEADAAHEVDALGGGPLGDLRGVILGHCGLLHHVLLRVDEARRVVHQ